MRKISIIVSKYDMEDINSFIKKYHSSMMEYSDNKWYFMSKFKDNPEEINFNIQVLDFNQLNEEDILKHMEINILKATEIAKKISTNQKYSDDFILVNEDHAVIDKIRNHLIKFQYEKNWSIIDYYADIFSTLLMSHLFKNGNKRFAYSFLRVLMNRSGFYVKWTYYPYNIDLLDKMNNSIEEKIACFEVCLSNRSTQDSICTLEQQQLEENETNREYCLSKLQKYKNEDIKTRKEMVKNEIKEWIKELICISY
ncbi:hypothetical protein DA803_00220 [[Mycoplasma] phocae]|uniref:Fido domain-containing protein n=1 Tax=[Mycoplasma] phocae TaxID=142651 RepID=A0A2Z5IPT9_9BACT|nr:type II toxin-antitoxin system death-on-curing family toxin [[Mycoplasma] phocae]AXE60527.1 hypothetical protein DA803_00220 [[Mycoplasma] phocae]